MMNIKKKMIVYLTAGCLMMANLSMTAMASTSTDVVSEKTVKAAVTLEGAYSEAVKEATAITGKVQGVKQSASIQALKYTNPLSSPKIGKKNYASKFKKGAGTHTVYAATGTYKVSCKAAKGWKIKEIRTITKIQKGKIVMVRLKKIKNNSAVKLKEGQNICIHIELYNQAQKSSIPVNVELKPAVELGT